MKPTTSKITAIGTALILGLSACSQADLGQGNEPGEIALAADLRTFNSCDVLLEDIQTKAVDFVGPWGFEQDHWLVQPALEGNFVDDLAVEDFTFEESAEESTATSDASGAETRFSTTNNQEFGVDEADFVKTNGTHLVVAKGSTLTIVDTSRNEVSHQIIIDADINLNELFVDEDTAVVIGASYGTFEVEPNGGIGDSSFFEPTNGPTLEVISIDLDSGQVTDSQALNGSYVSARLVDETIRIVSNHTVGGELGFVTPSFGQNGPSDRALEVAEEANRQAILDSVITDWIPENPDGSLVIDCENLFAPSTFSGFGLTAVTTLNLDSDLDITSTTGVMADGSTVYSSQDRLVVSYQDWVEAGTLSRTFGFSNSRRTNIHSFDISNPNETSYAASGSVPGTTLNRFGFSEHEGYLRVATTRDDSSESLVTILEENDGKLELVGRVDDIGQGERITAVRYFGDIAYVVTFRQTDPFYTVDLSDPQNPEILGELKIPGFSSYLHPLDEDLVLAVGTDGTLEQANGIPVASIFDVSDLTNPRLIDKVRLTTGQGHSLVANDARAFTLWEDTAFIPVESWNNPAETGLAAVGVSRDLEIEARIQPETEQRCIASSHPFEEELAQIEQELTSGNIPDTEIGELEEFFFELQRESVALEQDCFIETRGFQRTVVVGDTLYAITHSQIHTYDLDSLTETGAIELT